MIWIGASQGQHKDWGVIIMVLQNKNYLKLFSWCVVFKRAPHCHIFLKVNNISQHSWDLVQNIWITHPWCTVARSAAWINALYINTNLHINNDDSIFISVSQSAATQLFIMYTHVPDMSSQFFYYVVSVDTVIKLSLSSACSPFIKLQVVPAFSWKSLFVRQW